MLQPRITYVKALRGQRLLLRYETGEQGIFDVSPYIKGSWFGRLRDQQYFASVHLIDGGNGIEWADGQDVAPHDLYELMEREPDIAASAASNPTG